MVYTPAVHAGVPVKEENFVREDIEGIPFFIRKDMIEKGYEINWVGLWIFGSFNVIEL